MITSSLNSLENFLTVNCHTCRCFDAKTDLAAADSYYCDLDVIVDADRFTDPSSKDKHLNSFFSLAERIPAVISGIHKI